MSYLDMAQGEKPLRDLAHSGRSAGGSQQTEVDKIHQQLIQRIFRMRTAVSRLKGDVAKLGGPSDTVELRKSVSEAMSKTQDDAQEIKQQLMGVAPEKKNRQTAKILSDFEITLKDFQTTMRVAKGKEAANLPKKKPSIANTPFAHSSQDLEGRFQDTERQVLLQEQQRKDDLVLINEMEYNETLIDERDQGIAEIQQQIGEVNEIFQDLAVLVNDQGLQIDDLEANITRTADRTKEGTRELVQAERSQRAARNRSCYIIVIVAIILIVLALVLTV